MRSFLVTLGAVLLCACVSAPPAPAPGRAGAYGYLRLVPLDGVPTSGAANAYGDREFEGVSFVDYSKPGFAVVYTEGPARPDDATALAIRAGATGVHFDPPHAAIAAGGAITITNESDASHVVSCPGAGLVKPLAAGESLAIHAATPGEWPIFLLDVAGEEARVFAAPGPYRVVSSSGRYELTDLEPGRAQLRAWHPRFPPASTSVDLAAGAVQRVDLELRVGDHDEDVDAP